MDFGDKDIEGKAMANGGRRVSWTPQPDESVTVKITPIDADLSGDGMVQLFHPQDTDDTTDPIKVLNTRNRNKYQIVFTWAEDAYTTLTTANQITTADKAAYRITAKNVYVSSYKPSFDDKELTAEVTFKWAPFGRTGYANKKEESTSTTAIPASTDYTTANEFSAF